jgi:alpha-beta hydrolase superfamily lysophospholipase
MQVDDLYIFVGVVEQRVGGRLPAASTFLGGQSMGGLVAALGALRCQERWAGLVVFSGAMGVVWTLVLRCGLALSGCDGPMHVNRCVGIDDAGVKPA